MTKDRLIREADKYLALSERYKDNDDLVNARYYEGKANGLREAIRLSEKEEAKRISILEGRE